MQDLLKAIARHASKMQRHRIGCRCIRCWTISGSMTTRDIIIFGISGLV